MKKHKWNKDNECLHCKVGREMRTRKLLMAITESPPYNHYKYDSLYFYTDMFGNPLGFTRPKCIPPKTYDDL